MVRISSLKYLVNFIFKKQGWSEISDVESNVDTQEDRKNARDKAAEMLKNRILNDGVFSLIDKSDVHICPMELERVKK